jgi:hypothetical protein
MSAAVAVEGEVRHFPSLNLGSFNLRLVRIGDSSMFSLVLAVFVMCSARPKILDYGFPALGFKCAHSVAADRDEEELFRERTKSERDL